MVMRMTSIEAHEEITGNGKELDMETSTVSARVNGLKKLRKIKDEVKVECPISKKMFILWSVCDERD